MFYNPKISNYNGPIKRQHMVYNYEANMWQFETQLPGSWHHGGTLGSKKYL
ncbi:MAG: hypothetical protein BAJALOKI1v1_1340001 [Promethearchaeota archaeon]|nr:MAG: hypothetical protein BAJALOKI1v1_1340001 [Candidatus Lokiarchaeota archaeon]